ncbi:MAG: HNH endonuclease signature motif containing protein [Acidimicrobiales bacterium]
MPDSVVSLSRSLRSTLATFEPAEMAATDCALVAEELAATEKACAAARLLAGARAVAAGAHRQRGFNNGADWMARHAGSTGSQARRELQTASQLGACPETKEALLAGEVSVQQAGEIVLGEAEAPGAEHDLLEVARQSDLSRLRDKARQHRQARTEPEELRRRQQGARHFRHWRDGLGMVCFQGSLTPEIGLPFIGRLEAVAHKKRRDKRAQGLKTEPFEADAADALAYLLAQGSQADPEADSGEHKAGSKTGSRAGHSAELVIVCDINTWRRGHRHQGEPCHLLGGGPIPVGLARELSADAFLKAVIHDGTNIHTIKHFGRHLPAPLRTALDLGRPPTFDGRACTECGRTYGLENDHIDPVANNGPTSYENLHPLCWHDHKAKTEQDRKAGLLKRRGSVGQDSRPGYPAPSPDEITSFEPSAGDTS